VLKTTALIIALATSAAAAQAPARLPTVPQARHLLEQAYAENRAAFLAKDADAVIRQRTSDFEATTPDGAKHGATEMADATRRLIASVNEWVQIDLKLGDVSVAPTGLAADVDQHTIRKQMRDGQLRRLENWVTQRETWVETPDGLKIRRVDNIRNQCVLIDGNPRDAGQEAACISRGVWKRTGKSERG